MAKLYFRYGVMGSSKTANALMVRYNYEERGQDALLVKPAVDQRDGARFVASRAGLSHPCIYFSDLMEMTPRLNSFHQIRYLIHIHIKNFTVLLERIKAEKERK